MPLNQDYDVGKAFKRIEDELIASMIRNLRRHRVEEIKEEKQWSMWQAEQLKSLEKYRRTNLKKYSGLFQDINDKMSALISIARIEGNTDQEIAILDAIRKGFVPKRRIRKGMTGEFFKLNDRKLEALINATSNDMEKAETAVLRRANDQYRQIIFDSQVYANTGAATYEKAVDMATKDFLAAGLTCIEYANGARHTISDYADMAIKTATKRAYLQGEGEKRREWGISTVIINKRGDNPCPLCVPFVGKVMIDDVWSGGSSKDGPHPLLSTAISYGLYHPRCRDSHTTYFPGLSSGDSTWTREELEKIKADYAIEQKEQYAKRQAEKFGRLAEYSLDPESKQEYEAKAEEWRERANFVEKSKDSDIIKSNNTEEERSRYSPGSDSRAIVADIVGTDDYNTRMKRVGESEKIANIMLYQSRKTLWRRNGTPFEDLIYIDPESGEYLAQRLIDKAGEVVPTEEMKAMVEGKPRKIIAIHNHPHNMLPSLSDLQNAKRYKYSIIVCHDGTIIKFSTNDTVDLRRADRLLDSMQSRFTSNEDLSVDLSMLSSCGVDMEVIR